MDDVEIIATIKKNDDNEIRITTGEYKGYPYADIRAYWNSPEAGKFIPTKSGIRVSIKHLDQVIAALQEIRGRHG